MPDKLALAFQVGANGKYAEGMFLDMFTNEKKTSKRMKTVYAMVDVDPLMYEELRQIQASNDEECFDKQGGGAHSYIGLNDLCKITRMPSSLENAWRGRSAVPIMSCPRFRPSDLRRVLNDRRDKSAINRRVGTADFINGALGTGMIDTVLLPDRNVVSSGTFTVGAAGDYTTWVTAAADIAALLTGNLFFDLIANIATTSDITINTDLAGFILKFFSLTPPEGDPTQGFRWAPNDGGSGPNGFRPNVLSNTGGSGAKLEISDFRVFRTAAAQNDPSRSPFRLQDVSTAGLLIQIHDLMMDYDNKLGRGFRMGDADVLWELWNVTIARFRPNNLNNGGEAFAGFSAFAGSKVENCVAHGCDIGFNLGNSANWNFKNCFSFENTDFGGSAVAAFEAHLNATGSNNASEDTSVSDGNWGTGTNNQPSQVDTDQFVNDDPTDPDYLRLKTPLPTFATLGVAPAITDNTEGIRGTPRPGSDGSTSIGVAEGNVPEINASNAILKEITADATGVLITFTDMVSEIYIQVRENSGAASVCYVAINGIPPSATVGAGRIGMLENAAQSIQGQIRSVGFIMDSGTAIVEVAGYKTLTPGRVGFQTNS